ncbi:MAG TPA: DUF3299 domain-containing protein [Verrucomicrobiae bacterium]|nr:DUF3299 domain-containing protein [Verrucomicrobiae bacterium]
MHRNRPFFLICSHGILVLALTACGPSQKVSDKTTVPVHGDLIAPAPAMQPKPVAVAPAEIQPGSASSANLTSVPSSTPTIAAAVIPSRTSIATEASTKKDDSSAIDYLAVGFDKLASYNFEVDNSPATNVTPATDKANDQIPARVKSLDNKKVSIRGFMLPLKVSKGVVTEFLIMKDQSLCCYGSVPKITEWVSVKTPAEHGVKSIMDEPVNIEGTLHVGAMRENGYLIGIYHMDGDKLIAPDQ